MRQSLCILLEECRDFIFYYFFKQAHENLGMVMVFTIVSAAHERLNQFMERLKLRKEDEKLRKEKEAEEAERIRFTGTPVTLETFLVWRTAFLKELTLTKKSKEETFKGKLTGKEFSISILILGCVQHVCTYNIQN